MEQSVSKNTIISELTKSPHGSYVDYTPTVTRAAKEDPEFLARLISWNRDNCEIRDAKVGIPVISLTVPEFCATPEFVENSLAHLAILDPRNLVKALEFERGLKTPRRHNAIKRMVTQYLRYREADWNGRFVPTATRFRSALKSLYTGFRIPRSEAVGEVLFGGERGGPRRAPVKGSVFEGIARLKDMSASEAAGFITARRIPYLTARAALGDRIGEPDILHALIGRMSPTELVTSAKELEKLGIRNLPAVRSAFEKALERAAKSTKNVLKTTQAVDAVEDVVIKAKLQGLQERQLDAVKSVDGDWLVAGDCSGSMSAAIEGARQVAGTLARLVKGKVYLVFFSTTPRFIEVTGKSMEEITKETRYVTANGGTSIGCGLQYLLDRKIQVDGIAVVSDARENNNPMFVQVYDAYTKMVGHKPPVYLYRCGAKQRWPHPDLDLADTMRAAGHDLQEFVLGKSADYYSIPQIAQTMTVQRYGLIDRVLNTKLITLEMVFGGELATFGKKSKRKEKIVHV